MIKAIVEKIIAAFHIMSQEEESSRTEHMSLSSNDGEVQSEQRSKSPSPARKRGAQLQLIASTTKKRRSGTALSDVSRNLDIENDDSSCNKMAGTLKDLLEEAQGQMPDAQDEVDLELICRYVLGLDDGIAKLEAKKEKLEISKGKIEHSADSLKKYLNLFEELQQFVAESSAAAKKLSSELSSILKGFGDKESVMNEHIGKIKEDFNKATTNHQDKDKKLSVVQVHLKKRRELKEKAEELPSLMEADMQATQDARNKQVKDLKQLIEVQKFYKTLSKTLIKPVEVDQGLMEEYFGVTVCTSYYFEESVFQANHSGSNDKYKFARMALALLQIEAGLKHTDEGLAATVFQNSGLHDDDRDKIRSAIKSHLSGQRPVEEVTVKHADSQWKQLSGSADNAGSHPLGNVDAFFIVAKLTVVVVRPIIIDDGIRLCALAPELNKCIELTPSAGASLGLMSVIELLLCRSIESDSVIVYTISSN